MPQARVEDRPLESGALEDVLRLVQPGVAHRGIQLTAEAEVESALRVPSTAMRQTRPAIATRSMLLQPSL